jgi:predicted phosphodiesterase
MERVLAFLLLVAAFAQGQLVTPVWVEMGDGGRAIARVVADRVESCPSIQVDGFSRAMTARQPVPQGFLPACEFGLPAGVKSASVNGQALAVPRPDPSRIAVIGDTGCRIKGDRLQACNDPAKWPFEQVAGAAVSERPNLVIHVGDYLYREDPCPASAAAQCGGTPSGDHWDAWNADFFKPAAKLLASAPWVFSRGNHENCQRSWRGWFYYLDPHDWTGACQETPPPYTVQLGKFQLIAFDSSAVSEAQVQPEQRNTYAAELASLQPTNAWLVDHHPFFGIRPGDANGSPPVGQTATLQEAWDRAAPKGIDVILSGHTHLFEALSYGSARPFQILAGDGGTSLAAALPETVNGMDVHGVMVAASENQVQFGYVFFTRSGAGWNLALKTAANQNLAACRLKGRQASCKAASR